ncbi:INO80 complex subunit E-like isoform X2 [Palaemon carinicauda]|uniref:INO80 complex subunit E-like isoform X2 n=1 Tax=Palaemon carinicauda TaxID=392227 RepID=UPI0035B5B844
MMPVQTDGPDDYKAKYKTLKRKLKLLIYENECFQEELRKAQRSLLRVRRDKSFLLDRLLQYHRGPDSSSDSEQTEESDTEMEGKIDAKRKRLSMEGSVSSSVSTHGSSSKPPSKKKKSSNNSSSSSSKSSKHSSSKQTSSPHITLGSGVIGSDVQPTSSIATNVSSATLLPKLSGANLSAGALAALSARRQVGGLGGGSHNDGQLSREEVERRLAARQPMNDFTTTVSLTLPNQLFSDNIMEGDFMDDDVETSPSNIEEDVTVDNYD